MISLKSKTTQKLLNLFFLNEKKRFYINELARIVDEYPANIHKKLLELKKAGLLKDEFQGKERYFFLNKGYPFLKEYKSLVLKGLGFEKMLKEAIADVDDIDAVYLFGSYAKDKLSQESDIDILIIGNHNSLKLQKAILGLQKSSGREINFIEFSSQEFKQKKNSDPFLKSIFSEKHIKIL